MAYSSSHPGKYILVLDTETSGTTFKTFEETFQQYQVLSFGIIVADSQTFEPVKEFYIELKFDAEKYKWSKEAENIHGLTQEYLAEHGKNPEEAALEIANIIFEFFGSSKVCFLGHNTMFDITGLKQLLEPFGVMPPMHHVLLDTSPLGFVAIGKYKSNDVFKFFNGEDRNKHNSLDDAQQTLAVARGIRQLCDTALGG